MNINTGMPEKVEPAPWILLRGLTREIRHWGSFIGQLETALPGSQVIALDLPGNGQLHLQPSPMNVHAMVESCRAQLGARYIEPPYRLLAMSLGAMVAVAWASRYPQEVATQVLINTSMRPFNAFYERLRPANYAPLLRLAVFGGSPDAWERTILRFTSNRAGREAGNAVLPLWRALRQSHPVARANALRQLVAAIRFSAPIARPAAATLLLASAHDRLVSVACSKALANRWHCNLRVHPSAGHDLPLDDGPWVVDQVREWLNLSA